MKNKLCLSCFNEREYLLRKKTFNEVVIDYFPNPNNKDKDIVVVDCLECGEHEKYQFNFETMNWNHVYSIEI